MKTKLNPYLKEGCLKHRIYTSTVVCSIERHALANSDPVGDASLNATSYSHFNPSDSYQTLHCFCWMDKKPVYITHTREVSSKQKNGTRKISDCPQAVSLYNKYMGGVDMADDTCRV